MKKYLFLSVILMALVGLFLLLQQERNEPDVNQQDIIDSSDTYKNTIREKEQAAKAEVSDDKSDNGSDRIERYVRFTGKVIDVNGKAVKGAPVYATIYRQNLYKDPERNFLINRFNYEYRSIGLATIDDAPTDENGLFGFETTYNTTSSSTDMLIAYTPMGYAEYMEFELKKDVEIIDVTFQFLPVSTIDIKVFPKNSGANPSIRIVSNDPDMTPNRNKYDEIWNEESLKGRDNLSIENNEVSLSVPADSELTVKCYAVGYKPDERKIKSAASGGRIDITFDLVKAQSVTFKGRCMDEFGDPLRGVKILVAQEGLSRFKSAVTTTDGRFWVTGLYNTEIKQLVCWHQEYLPATVRDVNPQEEIVVALERKVKGSLIFTGRCIDENGVPIPDVTVSILQGGMFGYHYSSKSNEGGFFRFDDLIDLPIAALRVNKKGFRDRFIYDIELNKELVITLEETEHNNPHIRYGSPFNK